MIIYGWNHFKLKTIDPFSAGLSQTVNPGFTIEIRQRYFHLFWIPFFSLGKKWALRKGGQLYEMPEQYMQILRSRRDLHAKTPFYTYAGPLVAAFIFIAYSIGEKVREHKYEKQREQDFAATYTDNAEKFRKPSLDDYYVLTAVNGYSDRYAHITGLDKQNIQLSYITTSAYAYNPAEIAKLFLDPANTMETITISRGDSARIICPDYDDKDKFNGIELKGEQRKFRVKNIMRIKDPEINETH